MRTAPSYLNQRRRGNARQRPATPGAGSGGERAMSNEGYNARFINRQSFIELHARERAKALFDAGTSHELLGPFDRVESPWLPLQGVTPQQDDGCVGLIGHI